MTTVSFFNVVPQNVVVILNSLDPADGAVIEARTTGAQTSTLAMCEVDTADAPAAGALGLRGTNEVQVIAADDDDGPRYDVTIDPTATADDLNFFVFRTTLVGQRSDGTPGGIGIQAHIAIKQTIQTGVAPITIPLPTEE